MDLLSYISSPMAAQNPALMAGLGLLGSAYQQNAPFAGALQGVQAASQAGAQNAAAATARGRLQLIQSELDQRQQVNDLLQMISDPMSRYLLQAAPGQMAAAMYKQPQVSNPQRIFQEMGGEAGTGKTYQDWYNTDYKGSGTTVEVKTGSIPSGHEVIDTPEGPRLAPRPGSPEDVKRQEGLIALEGVYQDITELESLVQQHGTEAYGPIARRMKSLRNRIIGNLPAIRQTGVLQEGELKRIEQELPSGDAIFTPGTMILPLISGFREEVERTLNAKRDIYGMEPAAPPQQQDEGWSIVR